MSEGVIPALGFDVYGPPIIGVGDPQPTPYAPITQVMRMSVATAEDHAPSDGMSLDMAFYAESVLWLAPDATIETPVHIHITAHLVRPVSVWFEGIIIDPGGG